MTTLKKALFPISLSNSLFSTKAVLQAVAAIQIEYSELVFFIADDIQLYNRLIDGASVTNDLPKVTDRIRELGDQRRRWVMNHFLQSTPVRMGQPRLSVLSFRDITDESYLGILRRIRCSLEIGSPLGEAIQRAAQTFCARRRNLGVSLIIARRLAEDYLVEELAASIWLHVLHGISDEYYLGTTNTFIIDLYRGCLLPDLQALAGVPAREFSGNFYRAEASGDISVTWVTI